MDEIKKVYTIKDFKRCEGCLMLGDCSLNPYYTDKQGNEIICPCSLCLIKMICGKECRRLKTYYHSGCAKKVAKRL